MTTQQLQTQFAAAQARAVQLYASQSNPPTDSERTAIQAAIDEAQSIKKRISLEAGNDNMRAEIERLTGGMVASTRDGRGRSSIGHQVLESEVGQFLIKHRGRFPAGAWTSPASELMATTVDSGAASGGDLIITDYQPGILPVPTPRLVIANLIAPGTTTSNTIGYMKETSFTNAAAPVAEGQPKPESTIVFDAVTDPVIKIPHWLPVTEEMLEDVPTLRSYIDARLRLGVQLAEDDQLLNGNGTAPNMVGLLARAALAAAVVRTGSVTNADAILDQISAIELATGLPVDGIVMNPTNWGTILKSKDGSGAYYGGGPLASPANPILWGRPVAVTPAIVVGTALVGAYRTASQLFRKGGIRVEASNSHADFFVRNLIAIRAEERIALAVYRESAFGTVTSLT